MRIINLLPKAKQDDLRYKNLFRNLIRFFILAFASFAIVFIGQIATRWYLSYNLSSVNKNIEQLKNLSNKDENAALKNRIKLINNQINDFNTVIGSVPAWSKVISAFSALVPEKVAIQSLNVDSVKKQVYISGFSPSREQVIALYNNIAGDREHFTGIDYPLENVTKPTNVSFHFTFTVVDSLLK